MLITGHHTPQQELLQDTYLSREAPSTPSRFTSPPSSVPFPQQRNHVPQNPLSNPNTPRARPA
ncbi:unnamed protein product [Periconia digitata]|uniref:Uncharacterized protein n=1 Tax=Periconia digitata TaxID=1303443 RepID=A0A9W4UL10_9PLEO|nr:unnamed protein product [Periconia digitata]